MDLYQEISELLQKGKAGDVKELCQKGLDQGMKAGDLLNEALMPAMAVVGEKFKKNEVFVPEVLIAARAMNAGIEVLKPQLAGEGVESIGKVVIGTVKGDLHDIGKNLVKIMMEGKGLEVIDLGTDVSADQFLEAVEQNEAGVIACSALLTTTMTYMKDIVEKFKTAGKRDDVTIMIGGAPVTDSFCESIGADIYTADAASAADQAVAVVAG